MDILAMMCLQHHPKKGSQRLLLSTQRIFFGPAKSSPSSGATSNGQGKKRFWLQLFASLNNSYKVGPLLVISGVITSISRVITPVIQL